MKTKNFCRSQKGRNRKDFFPEVCSDFGLLQLEFPYLDFTLKELRFSEAKFSTVCIGHICFEGCYKEDEIEIIEIERN